MLMRPLEPLIPLTTGWRRRTFAFLLFLVSPFAATCQGVSTLPANACVYRMGDEAAWAAPVLDESGWRSYADWHSMAPQTHLWIRCHANLGPLRTIASPAIQVRFDSPYVLYLNGSEIGRFGNLKNGDFSLDAIRSYPVSAAEAATVPATLAFRVTDRTSMYGTIPLSALVTLPLELRMGDPVLLDSLRAREILARVTGHAVALVGYGIIGVLSFPLMVLFFFDRSRISILLFALAALSLCALRMNEFAAAALLPYSISAALFIGAVCNIGVTFTQFPFFFVLANRRIPVWTWVLLGVASISVVPTAVDALAGQHIPGWFGPLTHHWIRPATFIFYPLTALLPFFAFWPYRAVPARLRPLAALCLLWSSVDVAWFLLEATAVPIPGVPNLYARWGLTLLNVRGIATVFVVTALVALLFRDQRLVTLDRTLLAGELHAASEIQHMLAPEVMDHAPGLKIDVAFHPMRQVGGDFYLCRVLADGRQRVLLGDVSGKGAAAAMAATLLLGAATARDEDSPAALLGQLNRVFRENHLSGFATCLCADIASSGKLTLANAGHIPPYMNGNELVTDNGLPLGLAVNAVYQESTRELDRNAKLTLLTDGVVEARSADGELFGFERTATISDRSAEEIARSAQAFGQEDDITVLTVSRTPVPEGAKARQVISALRELPAEGGTGR